MGETKVVSQVLALKSYLEQSLEHNFASNTNKQYLIKLRSKDFNDKIVIRNYSDINSFVNYINKRLENDSVIDEIVIKVQN